VKVTSQLEATLLSKTLLNSAEIFTNVVPTLEVCIVTMLTFVVAIQKGKYGINHNNVMFVSNVMVMYLLEDLFVGTGMHSD
jgi:hypothetical protein